MEWKVILSNGEEISRKDIYSSKEKDPPFRKVIKYIGKFNLSIKNIEVYNFKDGYNFPVYDYELGSGNPSYFMIEENEQHEIPLSGGKAKLVNYYELISYFENGCRVYIKLDSKRGIISTYCRDAKKEDYFINYYNRFKK